MAEVPKGLERGETFSTKLGSITLARSEVPAVFWVRASGVVTPPLLREDLRRAEAFGAEHPGGWSYVAEVTDVRFAHPANLRELRRIRGLPNLDRYLVVAASRMQRWLIERGRRFVAPDAILETAAEAWTWCAPRADR